MEKTLEQTFYKSRLRTILFLTIGMLSLYASSIYLIDPLQQYRVATYFKPVYTNEVYQNPGLAKNYPYDTVIIGSSMTENFRPSYIKKQLGLQTLKLSISGSNSYEEKTMLETAINSGQVKNVIYGLDIFRLAGKGTREGFPNYLYSQKSMVDKMKYLFNLGNVDFILKTIVGNAGLAYRENINLDSAFTFNDEKAYSEKNVMSAFRDQLEHPENQQYSLPEMKSNFDKNVLSVLKNNPNITFYLFFPPYSVYTYKLYEHEGNLLSFLQMKRYVFEATKNLSNVKIYDFQTESRITKNLNNYKDISHYSGQINNYIIDNFKNEQYLLTEKNVNKFIQKLSDDVKTV